MKLSRREFLGGVVAGTLAAIAGRLPKMAEPKTAMPKSNVTFVVGMVKPMLKGEAVYIDSEGRMVRANDHDYVLGYAAPLTSAQIMGTGMEGLTMKLYA